MSELSAFVKNIHVSLYFCTRNTYVHVCVQQNMTFNVYDNDYLGIFDNIYSLVRPSKCPVKTFK